MTIDVKEVLDEIDTRLQKVEERLNRAKVQKHFTKELNEQSAWIELARFKIWLLGEKGEV